SAAFARASWLAGRVPAPLEVSRAHARARDGSSAHGQGRVPGGLAYSDRRKNGVRGREARQLRAPLALLSDLPGPSPRRPPSAGLRGFAHFSRRQAVGALSADGGVP